MFVIEKLWPLCKDSKIPKHMRAVLMMTFDRIYIAKKDHVRAASDIASFLEDLKNRIGQMRVNHWPAIAHFLLYCDPGYPAIGFRHTSVSEDPFLGPWNEECEEYDPFDWSTAYDMYAALDAESA